VQLDQFHGKQIEKNNNDQSPTIVGGWNRKKTVNKKNPKK
jgi:hypothetical protein